MKKIFIYIVIIYLFMFSIMPVFALNISSCESVIKGAIIDDKIPTITSTAIMIIKIAVPILLVIFGMIDLMKALIAQKEDEIKKGRQIFIKRLISGALVFFVFTIVQFIISFVADESNKKDIMTCAQCFINGDCTYEKKWDWNRGFNGDLVCPEGTKENKVGECVKK